MTIFMPGPLNPNEDHSYFYNDPAGFPAGSFPNSSAPPPAWGGPGWTEGQPNNTWANPINNSGFQTNSSSGYLDASSAFSWTSPPPPLSGGGNTGPFSRHYNGKTIPEAQEARKQYALNSSTEWCLQSYSNNRLRKSEVIADWFMVHNTYIILDPATKEVKYVLIRYSTESGEDIAVLSADEFCQSKFSQAMKNLRKKAGITRSQMDALIAYLIQQAPSSDIVLYQHHGFFMLEGMLKFISQSDMQNLPAEICPESVRIRKCLPAAASSLILKEWQQLFGSNPLLLITALIPVGCVLLYIFELLDISQPFIILFRPSDGVTAAQLNAMLQLNDYPVPNLECSEKAIQNYLSLCWDAPAPFHDTAFADEYKKTNPGLHALLRAACNTDSKNRIGRNVITLVSEHLASTSHQIAPDNTVSLSMNSVTLHASPEDIHTLTKLMESVVISTILGDPARVEEYFRQEKQRIDGLIGSLDEYSDSYKGLLMFLGITAGFLKRFLDVDMPSLVQLIKIVEDLRLQNNQILSVDQEIMMDFTHILSECLRSRVFAMTRKQPNMRIDPHGTTAVIDGTRLYLSRELLDEVLKQMTVSHRFRPLINALKNLKALEATDGDTHPFRATTLEGQTCLFYWYDIPSDLLDLDIQHKLNNLDSEKFWLAPDEIPAGKFIPLLRDSCGRVAGKLIRQQDADNGHFYVTGQSGAGKTFLLCILMAAVRLLGHNVVVFDNNDSFPKEAMEWNLSEKFVKEKVSFIDVDSKNIPVDLFRIDRKAKLTVQKAALVDIITAGVGELSAPQKNTLRSALSDMLNLLNPDEPIRTGDILAMLDEEGATYESLRNRLEPLFEDIDELGMKNQSWDELFTQNKGKIIVIRTASGRSKHGDQLIDMLLESLFKYQRKHPEIPLDLFIDECQNQNFSEGSPIRGILKEGRRFHIALFGATQDYYPRNSELGSSMGKSGTQVFLQPTQNSESAVASELRFKKNDAARFDLMQRGDAIIKGAFFSKTEQRNTPCTLSGQVIPYADNDAESKTETEANNTTEADENTDMSEQ